ncbi:MAG: integrase, partial [Pseudomonadota bacterium]|nr:integrase [Pseudomonadota bacterium]
MTAHAIHLSNVRAKLTPRREPYWAAPLERGLSLGVRKLPDGATWIARLHDDEKRHRYHSLGHVTSTVDYQA